MRRRTMRREGGNDFDHSALRHSTPDSHRFSERQVSNIVRHVRDFRTGLCSSYRRYVCRECPDILKNAARRLFKISKQTFRRRMLVANLDSTKSAGARKQAGRKNRRDET
jgi:hypothetical protein